MRLSESQVVKVQRFLNDELMSEVVFSVLQESFMKARSNKEVHYLAAKSLSLEFLEEAKRDLEKYRNPSTEATQSSPTPHV